MNNNKFYKIGVAVSVLLIGVIVACIVIAQKQDDKVAKAEDFPSVSSSTNVVENEVNVAEQTDFEEIAKVEENKNTENDSKNVTTKNNKTENTTSDKSAQNTTSKKSNDTKNQNKKSTDKTEDKKSVDPTFKYPVIGEVLTEYAKDKLVYSNTLDEWITHTGIDIKAEKTTVVKASADGTVKAIKTDPRYGLTVVIEHTNGFSTVYSNLLTAEFVKEGEKVTSGQTIGTVGNTDHENIKLGKAGRTRHMGIRPTVRGSVMNPVDHPHGGGEGKAPVGHAGPMTPWGKPALGYKTRKKNKKSDKMITKRRK